MRLRKLLALFLTFSLLLGCTSNPAKPSSASPSAEPSAESSLPAAPGMNGKAVGFLFVGGTDDFGYNQAIYQSTVAVDNAFPDLNIIRKENIPESAESEKAMEDMIKSGARIVFATSSGYTKFAANVAKRHPEVIFYVQGGDQTLPNMGTFAFSFWKEMYLMGYAAGKQSKSGKTGFVVAFPSSRLLLQVNAFTVGLRAAQPKATAKVVFINNWCDPVKQADAATNLIDEGIDVITQVQNCTKTIHQIAEKQGIKTIGYQVDGSNIAPKSWLTGLVFDRSKLFIDMVKTAQEGRFTGSRYDGSLILQNDTEKVIQMASFGQSVPDELKHLMSRQLSDIQSGKLKPLVGPIKDQAGAVRIAAGASPTEEELNKTNYFVEGVIGEIPK
ncbi:BMP family ABC transporter substrate-binding protein [Paenibacillus cremeus]|uniref:BMP family ABC transporter substrate-binding protein n=1 Tax=Paenibacillus cremeus TaxID=2163881 RepID=A0A559K680_9BACL|nr:BMP family ABC transporter substrate-binding protein [Paenibacillus cremeus]TVY07613.1 BMP family ABC transporter substrate-binding protein [Paenibacillus cremeus]